MAPPIARHVAQKQLGELLGRKVTIGRLRINPSALSVTVGDFRVYEPDQLGSAGGHVEFKLKKD